MPESVADWMKRAKSSLALARQGKHQEVLLEDLCFHCQQAVEKALKGLLVHRGLMFPKTHDIEKLIALLETNGLTIPLHVRNAIILTDYAVSTRYPGVYEPVDDSTYEEACDTAQAVLHWVLHITGD